MCVDEACLEKGYGVWTNLRVHVYTSRACHTATVDATMSLWQIKYIEENALACQLLYLEMLVFRSFMIVSDVAWCDIWKYVLSY